MFFLYVIQQPSNFSIREVVWNDKVAKIFCYFIVDLREG